MLLVIMPFSQRVRSLPLISSLACQPRSNTAAPCSSAWNSAAVSPKVAGVSPPR